MTIEAHDEGRQTLKRRGLIAGAAALAAGALAKQGAQPIAAFVGNTSGGNLVIGASEFPYGLATHTANTATYPTELKNTLGPVTVSIGPPQQGVGLLVMGTDGHEGIHGYCNSPFEQTGLNGGWAVAGSSDVGIGVYGNLLNGPQADGGYGVYGNAGGNFDAVGVRGDAHHSTSVAVQGVNALGTGIQGISTQGIGVRGESASGTGIYGATGASYQYGILGTTYAANSTAIAGTCTGNGSSAFSGGTANPNAYAGVFQGNVVIQGKLVVSDPSYKSGVLRHPDGSHRLVYCVESPESWIEDFGEGKLANGKAEIALDKDFAAVVLTDRYHVFLTEQDEHHHLIVKGKTATSFTVEADSALAALKGKKATDLNGTFSYRIVAKPKTTVKSERLGKFVMPTLKLPDPAALPAPTPVQPTKAKQ